jgi:hypothetical protein
VLLAVVVGGVIWSNALQYRDVNLAPRDQLAELEEIGELIDGQGPTLMTEYQPYGVRHFLRDADPEAASELRRRQVPLAEGGTLPKGEYADTDRLRIDGLTVYRTLVLRRGPDQSRPPTPYGLAWRGEYYEVWQRPQVAPPKITHLGLGEDPRPTGRPDCAEVRTLAASTDPGGTLVAAERAPVVVAPLEAADYPSTWGVVGEGEQVIPRGPGDITTTVTISRAATYEVWLRGSVRARVELLVDGRASGSVRHQLNNSGLSVLLGEAELTTGEHEITVLFHGSDLHPGSGGAARAIGPLVLSDAGTADVAVTLVDAAEAEQTLCGRRWDWIEALG